jgi:hypothetical protein
MQETCAMKLLIWPAVWCIKGVETGPCRRPAVAVRPPGMPPGQILRRHLQTYTSVHG